MTQHCFRREVIIRAQYLIVLKQSMIQEFVLWYLRLKSEPPLMFVSNTLVESLLFWEKKPRTRTVVIWEKKVEKNLNQLWRKNHNTSRLDSQTGVFRTSLNHVNSKVIPYRMHIERAEKNKVHGRNSVHQFSIPAVRDNRCTLLQFL